MRWMLKVAAVAVGTAGMLGMAGDAAADRGGRDWGGRDRNGWDRNGWDRDGGLILFSEAGYAGQSLALRRDVDNLAQLPPWNDRARSLVVRSGTWEICRHAGFSDCRILRAGAQVPDLGQVGLYDHVSSLREVSAYAGRPIDRDDRYGRDDRDDRFHSVYPPAPVHPTPPRRPVIVWDDHDGRGHGGRNDHDLSRCQQRVYAGFVQRYGRSERISFRGESHDGVVRWGRDTWRYRCANGQIHIWQ